MFSRVRLVLERLRRVPHTSERQLAQADEPALVKTSTKRELQNLDYFEWLRRVIA